MTKRFWEHDDDIRLEDVKTEADKLKYSQMIYRRHQEIGWDEPPDAILDLERFPMEDPARPWMHPEYWIMVGRAEREKKRLLRGK
jgi:hypothetical protein